MESVVQILWADGEMMGSIDIRQGSEALVSSAFMSWIMWGGWEICAWKQSRDHNAGFWKLHACSLCNLFYGFCSPVALRMQVICPSVDDDGVGFAKGVLIKETEGLVSVVTAFGGYSSREQFFGVQGLPIGIHDEYHLCVRCCRVL